MNKALPRVSSRSAPRNYHRHAAFAGAQFIAEEADQVALFQKNADENIILPRVSVPTLVMHCRDDAVQPFEEGRFLEASIPGTHFVALEGRNHVILEGDPSWNRFHLEIRNFLAQ